MLFEANKEKWGPLGFQYATDEFMRVEGRTQEEAYAKLPNLDSETKHGWSSSWSIWNIQPVPITTRIFGLRPGDKFKCIGRLSNIYTKVKSESDEFSLDQYATHDNHAEDTSPAKFSKDTEIIRIF